MPLYCIIIMLVENSFYFELRLYKYYTERNTFYMKRNEAKKNKSNDLKKNNKKKNRKTTILLLLYWKN